MNPVIYNVTVKADHSIAVAWLHWMKEEHIPDIIATGCFSRASILHLLETDETEGPTYAVQYFTADPANYNRYIRDFSGEMRRRAMEKWGDKFIAFRSVMEVVH